MKSPNSLSDSELRSYSDGHLKYELDMLIWSAGILATLAMIKDKGLLPWAINNAVLESFSIHARNLIDFLYSKSLNKDRPTDIVVDDFIDQPTLSKFLPPIDPLLKEVITKANKQVAHLTRDRIDYELQGKEWRFIEVANKIVSVFQILAPHFPAERIGGNFRNQISQAGLIVPLVRSFVISDSHDSVGVEFLIERARN